ncbi:MAG: hypothetical protein ACE5G3_02115 [Gammaproteobacteria bacterium]
MTEDTAKFDTALARLRDSEPAIADGGFTAAVMTQLPRRVKVPAWIENALMLGATGLASAIAAAHAPLPDMLGLLEALTANFWTTLAAGAALTYAGAFGAIWSAKKY